jgi:putative ABC transport system permease protein
MLGTYVKTALRSLSRNRGYALINVLGLSLGITFALMAYLIISFELSVDQFHAKKDRIYRINSNIRSAEGVDYDMGSQAPLGAALRAEFPSLERVTVCNYQGGGLLSVSGPGGTRSKFQEREGIAFVQPEFFDLFDFPWVSGNPRSSLSAPNSVVLTETAARKYFGSENPLGRVIRLDNEKDLTVTGILRAFPVNTDFPFSVVVSWATLEATGKDPGGRVLNSWTHTASDVNTFVLLAPGEDPAHFESLLPAFLAHHFDNTGPFTRFYTVQALGSIHRDTRYGNYGRRTSSPSTLWALAVIGLLLVVTACINFINLATAQSLQRSREVGVRKVLGGNRAQLIAQFMTETFAITLPAVVLSFVFAELLLPAVSLMLEIPVPSGALAEAPTLGFLVLLTLIVTFLSGLYPALVLSGFRPVTALSRRLTTLQPGGMAVRKGLVVLQFAITQILVVATIVIARQMDYCMTRDLGFEKDAVVTVHLPLNDSERLQRFRAELSHQAGIRSFTFDAAPPASDSHWTSGFTFNDGKENKEIRVDLKWGDDQYLATYGLRLLAGRNVAPSDTLREFLINEAAMKKMGITNPRDAVGKVISYGGKKNYPVAVVVADFTPGTLHEEVTACLLGTHSHGYYESSFKLDGTDTRGTIEKIERAWNGVFPEYIFEFHFLNDRIAAFYRQESKVSLLIDVFSGVAVLIGTIGLFGLVSFVAARRTKEIGVRKVLGATPAYILVMFGREFCVLILLAFVLAAPLATAAMNSWLDDFAFRISIGPAMYFIAFGLTAAIALATIAYRTVRASIANPVESLRYE